MEVKKNQGYVERIISDYKNLFDEKIIQAGYLVALENYDVKMFVSIYDKSGVKPVPNFIGLIKQLSEQKDGERFSKLLNISNSW